MKVLMLNGSPKANGNTNTALTEIGKELERQGIEYEIFQIGGKPVNDCVSCGRCGEDGCEFGIDGVNDFIQKAKEADGFIFGTPVYYAHPTGKVLAFLDRVFYAGSKNFAYKPGASVAVARRAGTTASYDVMNKYFGISQMPIISSTYWNITHGQKPGEAAADEEGMQTMRNLARNMSWILKSIEAGRNAGVALPDTERGKRTNFIR